MCSFSVRLRLTFVESGTVGRYSTSVCSMRFCLPSYFSFEHVTALGEMGSLSALGVVSVLSLPKH